MSDAGLIALGAAAGLTVLGAASGAWFSSVSKRRDDERTRTGVRIGVLEEWVNMERGRQAGLREAQNRGGDAR